MQTTRNLRYRKKIHEAFDSLDSKQVGYIGREEIEDSLIGLGLVETTEEV
ncbi:MAG: EF-hand domain-containing protein [Candidatus Pacebacteria bacterium]|nr:EF-hand domain-containing protein [Candidatus Paceibacterota bacterium]